MKESILIILIGLSGGITVGSAAAAFITLLEFIPRLTQVTETREYIKLYQYVFTFGATLFSFIYFSKFTLGLNQYLAIPIGLIMGMFVGLFSSALAEVLNVIPVFAKKFKMQGQLKFIIIALMSGKVLGSIWYWLVFTKQ